MQRTFLVPIRDIHSYRFVGPEALATYPPRVTRERVLNFRILRVGMKPNSFSLAFRLGNSGLLAPRDRCYTYKALAPVFVTRARVCVRRLSLLGLQPHYFTIQLGRVCIKFSGDTVGRGGPI